MKRSVPFSLLLSLVLLGCQQPSSDDDDVQQQSVSIPLSSWISDTTNESFHAAYAVVERSSNKEVRVDLEMAFPSGSGEYYYLLTNTSAVPTASASLANLSSARSAHATAEKDALTRSSGGPLVRRELPYLDEMTKWASARAKKARAISGSVANTGVVHSFTQGQTGTFFDSLWDTNAYSQVPASSIHAVTLRKQVTSSSGRILNIWVANAAWDEEADGTPASPTTGLVHGVKAQMVNDLADKFLLASGTNDIYHWVTGILGEEWPAIGAPTLSGETPIVGGGNIHIFLVNLNPGGTANGTLMGYFHALNNFSGYTGSNEKILFALNADSLANPDNDGDPGTSDNGQWSLGDYWPSEIVSTLAHEFQHMVHFYQKQVRNNLSESTDTWINEMASQVIEDLVADKLGVAGPRGLANDPSSGTTGMTSGRIPLFNYYHEEVPLTAWNYNNSLPNYSNSYAFGAWALRNYGGPAFLQRLVQSRYVDETAVVDAAQAVGQVSTSYPALVREWGLATFLGGSSLRVGLRYQGGTSTGQSWTPGQTFTVGDINLWNYRQVTLSNQAAASGPYVYDAVDRSTKVAPGSTLFLFGGRGTFSSGQIVRDTLTLPPNVALTVVRLGP